MSEKDHAENLISEEETNGVEISTVNVVISAVEEEVNKFVDQKFDAIKSEVLNELDDLANGFPLIDIIKILMEFKEHCLFTFQTCSISFYSGLHLRINVDLCV